MCLRWPNGARTCRKCPERRYSVQAAVHQSCDQWIRATFTKSEMVFRADCSRQLKSMLLVRAEKRPELDQSTREKALTIIALQFSRTMNCLPLLSSLEKFDQAGRVRDPSAHLRQGSGLHSGRKPPDHHCFGWQEERQKVL